MPDLTVKVNKYAWVDTAYDFEGAIAVIQGRAVDEVIRAYGGSPDQPLGNYQYEEAGRIGAGIPGLTEPIGLVVQIIELPDGAVVAMEPGCGWAGQDRHVAERASAGGAHFFGVYWCHSNAGSQMIEAIDGKITAQFDPFHVRPGKTVPPDGYSDIWPDWLAGAPRGKYGLDESARMALMEQQTGVAFDRVWLDQPWPTYCIPEPGT